MRREVIRSRGAACTGACFALALLLAAPSEARTADDVRADEAAYLAIGEDFRARLIADPAMSERERGVLRSMRFVYAKSVSPEVRAEVRFAERRIVLSDGMMAIVDALVRIGVAAPVPAGAASVAPDLSACRREYVSRVLAIGYRDVAVCEARGARPCSDALRSVPDFETFREGDGSRACAGEGPVGVASAPEQRRAEALVAAFLRETVARLVAWQLIEAYEPVPGMQFQQFCRESLVRPWVERERADRGLDESQRARLIDMRVFVQRNFGMDYAGCHPAIDTLPASLKPPLRQPARD